jgi:hypothetical protein
MKTLPLLGLAAALPLAAQGTLDSPSFGGSRVFSEGVHSFGNPARFDRCLPGYYFGYQDGDLKAKGNAAALEDLARGSDLPAALAALEAAPWASRTTGYGLVLTQSGLHGSVSREQWNGLAASVDRDPAHLGANQGLNLTSADVIRANVDRVVLGAGSAEGSSGYGFAVRIERWSFGRRTAALNPAAGQDSLAKAPDLLDVSETPSTSTDVNLNGGYVMALGPGLRFGLMGDHLIPKTIAGLDLKGQVRAGFQLDVSPSAQISVEGDLNEAIRLPVSLPQKSLSASLRLAFGPALGLTLGAEKRSLGGASTTTAGATVYWKLPTLSVGFGFRFSDDAPLKGLLVRVNS